MRSTSTAAAAHHPRAERFHLIIPAFQQALPSETPCIVRALDGGTIRPVVDRRFPLEQLADAFRFEMRGGHFGKTGVEW
jgi:NADPH:quinone reductase-like Zn-dependent oxidoreductase